MAIKELRNIEEYAPPMGMPRMPLNMYPMGEVPDISDQISDHFKRHWLKYLLAGGLLAKPYMNTRNAYNIAKSEADSLGDTYHSQLARRQHNLDQIEKINKLLGDTLDPTTLKNLIDNNNKGRSEKNKIKDEAELRAFLNTKLQNHQNDIDAINSKLPDLERSLRRKINDVNSKATANDNTWLHSMFGFGRSPQKLNMDYYTPQNAPPPDPTMDYTLDTRDPAVIQAAQAQAQADQQLGGDGQVAATAQQPPAGLKKMLADINTASKTRQLNPNELALYNLSRKHPDHIDRLDAIIAAKQNGGLDAVTPQDLAFLNSHNIEPNQLHDVSHIVSGLSGETARLNAQNNRDDDKSAAARAQAELFAQGTFGGQEDAAAAQAAAQSNDTNGSDTTVPDSTNALSNVAPPRRMVRPPRRRIPAQVQVNTSGLGAAPAPAPAAAPAPAPAPAAAPASPSLIVAPNAAPAGPRVPLSDPNGRIIQHSNTNINDLVGKQLFTDNEDPEEYEYSGPDADDSYEEPSEHKKKKSGMSGHLGKLLAVGGALGAAALGAGAIHTMANTHQKNAEAFHQLGDVNRSREHYAKHNVLRSIDLIHKGKQLFTKHEDE